MGRWEEAYLGDLEFRERFLEEVGEGKFEGGESVVAVHERVNRRIKHDLYPQNKFRQS